MQQHWSGGEVCLVLQCLPSSSRYTVTQRGRTWFGVGWSRLHCGPCRLIPEAPPWWWWGEKWQTPSLFSMTQCPESLLWSRPPCAAGADKAVCLAPPTPLPWRLGWELNSASVCPSTGEAPPDMRSRLLLSCAAALQGRGPVSPNVDSAPDLPVNPGVTPLLPRCANRAADPSPKMGSAVRDPLTCS